MTTVWNCPVVDDCAFKKNLNCEFLSNDSVPLIIVYTYSVPKRRLFLQVEHRQVEYRLRRCGTVVSVERRYLTTCRSRLTESTWSTDEFSWCGAVSTTNDEMISYRPLKTHAALTPHRVAFCRCIVLVLWSRFSPIFIFIYSSLLQRLLLVLTLNTGQVHCR